MPDGVEFDVKFKIDEVEARMKHIEDSIGNVANNTDKHTNRMGASFRKVGAEANNLDSIISRVGTSVVAFFAVDRAVALGRSIIEVRSEFEKFTAVLTTAYGSSRKADEAMNMLKETAKETPFQLTELAQAFVLLKNRGVDPSKESLIKAGDFASSTGRTFQELSEALLNIGELEVWKKFGVNASLQGDKIKLSFRGLNMEVAKSTAGVLKAVEAFGSMEGISGSMKGQMETLGGKVSNFKDAWDQLLNKLGESGAFKDATTGATNLVESLTKMIDTVQTLNSSESLGFFEKLTLTFNKLSGQGAVANEIAAYLTKIEGTAKGLADDYVRRLENTIKGYTDVNKATSFLKDEQLRLLQQLEEAQNQGFAKGTPAQMATLVALRKEIIAINDLLKTPSKIDAILFSPKGGEDQTGLLKELNDKLKELKENRELLKTKDEIAANDRLTESYKKQIETIEAGVKRINDLQRASKGPALKSVTNTNLDKPLSVFPNTILPKTEYEKLTYIAPQNQIQKYAAAEQLKDYQSLFENIDKLNRDQLKKKLLAIQTELKYEKAKGQERIALEKQVADIINKLDTDQFNSIMNLGDSIVELGNTIGGSWGKALSDIAGNAQNVFGSFTDFSKSMTSATATFTDKFGAGIGLLSSGIGIAQTIVAAFAGESDEEKQRKYYEAQQTYITNITKLIELQTKALNDLQGAEKISTRNTTVASLKQDLTDIEKQAKANTRVFQGFEEVGNIFSRQMHDKWADLSKVSIEELTKMRDAWLKGPDEWTRQGFDKYGIFKSQDDFKVLDEYITKYQDTQEQIKQITNDIYAELTGSTYDSILSGIVDAFSDGMMSADEFSNNFEGSMKKALLNAFSRDNLEKQLQGWYNAFAEASKGGLTSTEIENLRLSLQTITTDAQTGLQTLLNASGLDLTSKTDTTNTSSMSGAIKSIQEDTANILAGQMNAIRINVIEQKNIALQGLQELVKIERNTYTLFEIRDLIKGNSNNQLINDRANGG